MVEAGSFTVNKIQLPKSHKKTTMDTLIINWEMSIDSEPGPVSEEIATGPMEPYHLDIRTINWN